MLKTLSKKFFPLLLILAFFRLSAATIIPLNLADLPSEFPTESHMLWSGQGQRIQVRGFWYPISAEQGVLTSFPGMKSCCLTHSSNIHLQLLVTGEDVASISAKRVITLEGVFKIDPQYNSSGELTQLYVLENAQEIKPILSYTLFWISGCALGIFLIYRFFLKNKMAKWLR